MVIGGTLRAGTGTTRCCISSVCVLCGVCVRVKSPGELHRRSLLERKKGLQQEKCLFYVAYRKSNPQESPACALTKVMSIGSFEMPKVDVSRQLY